MTCKFFYTHLTLFLPSTQSFFFFTNTKIHFFFITILLLQCVINFFLRKSHHKTFNVQQIENFNKFTKLSKNFGELEDKLIIQHFHHIHIRRHIRCILQILAHSRIHNTCIFHSYKNLEHPYESSEEE